MTAARFEFISSIRQENKEKNVKGFDGGKVKAKKT
jgi:hypothetical protein